MYLWQSSGSQWGVFIGFQADWIPSPIDSYFWCKIWVFPKIVVSQNGWFIMENNPIKMDDLGIPLFLDTSIRLPNLSCFRNPTKNWHPIPVPSLPPNPKLPDTLFSPTFGRGKIGCWPPKQGLHRVWKTMLLHLVSMLTAFFPDVTWSLFGPLPMIGRFGPPSKLWVDFLTIVKL